LASFDEVLNDTLLADLQGQITYGAVWAIDIPRLGGISPLKMERKSRGYFTKNEINLLIYMGIWVI
jgi:hypothetical protein